MRANRFDRTTEEARVAVKAIDVVFDVDLRLNHARLFGMPPGLKNSPE
jgi:hypothetical protein